MAHIVECSSFGNQFLSAFICRVWMVLLKDRNAQPLHELHRRFKEKGNCAFTCLRKIRWSSLRPGLSGDWHLPRSGERDPSAPKTFSSSKQPVSIIYRRREEQVQVHSRQEKASVEVPRFARWWERCLCWIWRRNLCPSGPEWLPSVWKTHRCPARRCNTRVWASQIKITMKQGAKQEILLWNSLPSSKFWKQTTQAGTHVRFKRRFHKSCLQHPEIDFLEKIMWLYISPRWTLAAQPVLRVFGQ